VTLATPLFEIFFRHHVGTLPGSERAKFEVCTFSHFGAIGI